MCSFCQKHSWFCQQFILVRALFHFAPNQGFCLRIFQQLKLKLKGKNNFFVQFVFLQLSKEIIFKSGTIFDKFVENVPVFPMQNGDWSPLLPGYWYGIAVECCLGTELDETGSYGIFYQDKAFLYQMRVNLQLL